MLWALVFSSLLLVCSATNYTWQGTSSGGNWGDASNWDPASVPTASDYAIFEYSSCSGIGDGAPDCPVNLGTSAVSIAGLVIKDTARRLAFTGTLTVTEYAYMEGFSFFNLVLTTQGTTVVVNPTLDSNSGQLWGTTWTLAGVTTTTFLDWQLTTTRITNSGTMTVLQGTNYGFDTLDSYAGGSGNTDYSKSSFTNAGTLNVYCLTGDEDVSTFEVTFVNTGIFNMLTGYLQFSSAQNIAYHLTTKWTGTISSAVGSTIEFYNGVHNFSTGLTWSVNGAISLFGSSGSWDSGQCGEAQWDFAVNIVSLITNYCFNARFNQPTNIALLNMEGGQITGPSKSIVIGNLTGGAGILVTAGAVPLFNGAITIMDGFGLVSTWSVKTGTTVQLNGTLSCTIHMDWYGEYVSKVGDFATPGGTFIINPSGRLVLHASDDTTVYAHYFYIPMHIYGRLDAVKAEDPAALRSDTEIGNLLGGGIIAGPVSAIKGLVDDQGQYSYGDIEFDGNWIISPGASFTGPGVICFLGNTGDVVTFDIPYTFTTTVSLFYQATFQFNYDVNFTTLWWAGGKFSSNNNAKLTLLQGSDHQFYAYNYQFSLSGVTINNYGNTIYSGSNSVKTFATSTFNNYGNFTTARFTFPTSDGIKLNFNNFGNYILGDAGGAASMLNFVNNGTVTNQVFTASNANNNFGWDATDVALLPTGSYVVNVYGSAEAFGNSEVPYDVASFLSSTSCRLGGTLHFNFVGYSPSAGEQYVLFVMNPTSSTNHVGTCTCQFDTITSNLGSGLSVGMLYDTSDATYYQDTFITAVICSSSNSTCTANKRVGATCPGYTGTTSSTTSKTTTATSSNPSSTGSTNPTTTTGSSNPSTGSSTSTTSAKSSTSTSSPTSSSSTTGSDQPSSASIVLPFLFALMSLVAMLA